LAPGSSSISWCRKPKIKLLSRLKSPGGEIATSIDQDARCPHQPFAHQARRLSGRGERGMTIQITRESGCNVLAASVSKKLTRRISISLRRSFRVNPKAIVNHTTAADRTHNRMPFDPCTELLRTLRARSPDLLRKRKSIPKRTFACSTLNLR
jgi:hypothetical protein